MRQIFLLCLLLLTACAALTPAPGGVPASLAPAPTTPVPERPTPLISASPTAIVPAPTSRAPTASPQTLTLSLLAEWHAPTANQLAWFPDGARLAVSTWDGVYIYEAATLTEQQHIDTGGPVGALAVSHDGRTLASSSWVTGLQLWDIATARRRTRFVLPAALADQTGATALAFSPDGRRLAVAAFGAISLLDSATGQLLHAWQQETYLDSSSVQVLTFSHHGRLLAADDPHGVWIMDVDTGALRHNLVSPHAGPPTQLAFSHDDRVLVAAGPQRLTFWDAATGALRRERPLTGFAAVALARDGLRLAGLGDGFIALSDAVTGQPRLRLMGHAGFAAQVAFSPSSTRLAALDANGTLWVWQTDIGRVVATLDRHLTWTTSPALSPDGETLAFGAGHRVWLWAPASGQPPRPVFTQPDIVASVRFSPDGRFLVTGGAAPEPHRAANGPTAAARVWDMATGRLHDTLPSQGYTVSALAFSPDGQLLATGGEDTLIRLWDLATGQLRRSLTGYQTSPVALAFTPDGRQLLSQAAPTEGCYEGCRAGWLPWREEPDYMRLWDVTTGQVSAMLDTPRGCGYEMAVLSPNGRLLVGNVCDGNGFWLQREGRPRERLRFPEPVRGLTFSPDGRYLAALTAEDNRLVVLDPAAGALLATAQPAESPAHWLTFLPNGRLLAWSAEAGTLRVWHARLGQP